jgi:ferrous iron transport protein B
MTAAAAAPLAALVGNPNAGKTSLFNALTGARQKVGNYPGVTVERKSGRLPLPDGRVAELIDLPGAYSLSPRSPDEAVTAAVVKGEAAGERQPQALVAVVDATNLPNHLRFVLELKAAGLPMVVALNMVDLAERDGLVIDVAALSARLALPVVPTVAVRRRGLDVLAGEVARELPDLAGRVPGPAAATPPAPAPTTLPTADLRQLQREAREIARAVTRHTSGAAQTTERLDRVLLHPVAGPLILMALLFTMFQAVFAAGEAPKDLLDLGLTQLNGWIAAHLPAGFLRSLLTEGVLAGVGAVVVFLPQILILFGFIIALEQSGYMVRAAFIMDRVMAAAGLNGRAFIPLLSSFACAVPGIMATRSIEDPRDRLTTILIAPLMTCSARLPVYTLIIGAFIPNRLVWGLFNLPGLVLFGLYLAGVSGAWLAALALRRTVVKGGGAGFLMELPKYQWPTLRDMGLGLYGRARAFLVRAGTIILASTVALWLLASFPKPPAGSTANPLEYSVAGRIGRALEHVFRPIGFNREISLALVPGLAAREVAVSALGTVYAIGDEGGGTRLVERLRREWPLPTGLAFLAWFVFAPQCLSTLAVTRRETNGWRWPAFLFAYLFVAAYAAAGVTYWTARLWGL